MVPKGDLREVKSEGLEGGGPKREGWKGVLKGDGAEKGSLKTMIPLRDKKIPFRRQRE